MSPAAALRLLHDVPIGDILLTTPSRLRAGVEGRTLRLRRVARPNAEQVDLLSRLKASLAALKLTLPDVSRTSRERCGEVTSELCRPRRDRLQQLPLTDRKDTPENVVKTSEKNRPPRYLQSRFTRATAQPGLGTIRFT